MLKRKRNQHKGQLEQRLVKKLGQRLVTILNKVVRKDLSDKVMFE